MKQQRYILKLAAVLCAMAYGTDASAASFSMESAVQAALMGNRDLIAARFAVKKAEGRLRQSGLLPNPELNSTASTDSWMDPATKALLPWDYTKSCRSQHVCPSRAKQAGSA